MYAKKSYASGGMTDPKKRTMSIHEQGIVDQGDGFIVYETPGGERLKVSVPDNFTLSPNKTYTAVMGQGGFKLELGGSSDFGPKDPPGQRGDMFNDGGIAKGKTGDQLIKEYEAILSRTGLSDEVRQKYSDKLSKVKATEKSFDNKFRNREVMKFMDGGMEAMLRNRGRGSEDRNYAGQYMGRIQEDEGGKFAEYEALDGSKTKAYIPDNMRLGEVGDYVPDMDFRILEVGGKRVLAMKER